MFLMYLFFGQNLADIPTLYHIDMKCCEGALSLLSKVGFSFISNVMDTLAEERDLQSAVYNHDEKGSG